MLVLFHHMHHSLSSELEHLIKVLESVPNSEAYVYQLRDDQQKTMDCLKVFQRAEGQHIGVSHSLQNGVFGIRLSCSDDLLNWTYVNTLDIHASQANIWPTENGAYLLAYEKDAPNPCWIRLRFYADFDSFCEVDFAAEYDIQQSLGPTAEGKPSFDSVKLASNQLSQSEIDLRFHYYKDAEVDRLAIGRLVGSRLW